MYALVYYLNAPLDYDLLVLGGRPKAALADEKLIVAYSFFKACGLWYTKLH